MNDNFMFWFDLASSGFGFIGIAASFWKRDLWAAAGWWLGAFGYLALALNHLK